MNSRRRRSDLTNINNSTNKYITNNNNNNNTNTNTKMNENMNSRSRGSDLYLKDLFDKSHIVLSQKLQDHKTTLENFLKTDNIDGAITMMKTEIIEDVFELLKANERLRTNQSTSLISNNLFNSLDLSD